MSEQTYKDVYGRIEEAQTRDMRVPVKCNLCQQVYDLCKGKPVARYADCTVYKTPCCGQTVDDRPRGWVSFPAFERVAGS